MGLARMARFGDQWDYRVFRSGRLSGYVHREFASEGLCRLLGDLLLSPPSLEKTLYRRYQSGSFVFRGVLTKLPRRMPTEGSIRSHEFMGSVFWLLQAGKEEPLRYQCPGAYLQCLRGLEASAARDSLLEACRPSGNRSVLSAS